MKSFRNPKYLERYEDVVFDLNKLLILLQERPMNKKEKA